MWSQRVEHDSALTHTHRGLLLLLFFNVKKCHSSLFWNKWKYFIIINIFIKIFVLTWNGLWVCYLKLNRHLLKFQFHGGINLPDFRLYYKNYSHQDSLVLAQRQKYRSMEQNRKSRDKSTYLWTPYLWQRRQKHITEKRQSLQKVELGKLVNYM